ncbi:Dyp-type peroxidase [Rhodocyclus tenuis]|uniref:Putative iron-dependent peroxidase n=1 Tax=Rhodocyclus tenuis TaxID=1066 RepID=A0A840G6D7_RHOTE|nr:Dyp-type peroxidase [Rhodocyclus tenuis]MBB4247446.1 putative iron-dependent peroxidase [Rhodocyclus tenuis]
MSQHQNGILAPLPSQARHLYFTLESAAGLDAALAALRRLADGDALVVGFGASLVQALGGKVDGLRIFPALAGAGVDVPSTQYALWCWLRGDDRGELLHRTRELAAALAPALRLLQINEAFVYQTGHDLTGYEDGTENPSGEDADAAALVSGDAPGLAGSSFAAVQNWQHDLAAFDKLPEGERDHIIGRRRSDNEELADAPESAHVKRTAQESFTPEAFVLRRSMPWSEGDSCGLAFLAFGHSLDAFEAQLTRMSGLVDGIVDGMFRISRPISGGYYWCPPLLDGRLDLRALGR